MKTLKFRAYDELQKRYYYSDNFLSLSNFFNKLDRLNVPLLNIQQFTGQIDEKNGLEIFAGDIKRWKFNNHIWNYECYWSVLDCGFRWKMIKHNEKQNKDSVDMPFETEEDYYNYVLKQNQRCLGFDKWSEIIGNKFENPELLK